MCRKPAMHDVADIQRCEELRACRLSVLEKVPTFGYSNGYGKQRSGSGGKR